MIRVQVLSGFLNQAMSSIANFGYGLFLLRTLEMKDFGIYNIAFAVMLFFGSALHGLLFVQMTFIAPTFPKAQQRKFIARVELLLFAIVLAVCCLSLFTLLWLKAAAPASQYPDLLVATVAISVAYGLKEFHIRLAFNEERGLDAVAIHLLLALTLFAGTLYVVSSGREFTLTLAMLLYALAHMIAFAYGQIRAQLGLRGHDWDDLAITFKHIWSGGKWETLTSVVMALRNQAHTIIVGAVVGPVGVAKINASRLLVTPAVMSIPALSQIMLARMAKIREAEGIKGIRSIQQKFAFGLGFIALAYSALLLIAYPFLADLLFGERYQDMFWLTFFWCCFAISWVMRATYHGAIQAARKFQMVSLINSISAAFALVAVYVMTLSFDLAGAIIGVVLGDLFVALALRRILIRLLNK